MTRTPDRAFQAAARDALLELVEQGGAARTAPGPSPAPRGREWIRTSFATLLVGGAVAAAWVGVAGIHPGRPDVPRPVGAAAAATTAPTGRPAPAPSPDPTAAPTPTSVPTPTSDATDAPQGSDGTTPPVLVVPTGWHLLTRPQLHDWVVASGVSADDLANRAIWEQEAWTDIRCMAGKGFVYDPSQAAAGPNGLTAAERQAFEVALYGPASDAPYDWRTAGCHGASVHEAGQDGAH